MKITHTVYNEEDCEALHNTLALLKKEREVLFRLIAGMEIAGIWHATYTENKLFDEYAKTVERVINPYDED